jgi:hypothetical protein
MKPLRRDKTGIRMIGTLHRPGLFAGVGGGAVPFSPTDNADAIEFYNAWDTTKHTYVAARTAASYEAAAGVVTLTCAENPTGFRTVGAGDVVVVSTGNSEVDGEFTITAASGATITYAQAFVSPTVSPVSLTGTVQWKHRKVSSVAGMRGTYSFDQATLANMPQWNDTTKEMLFIEARSYFLNIPSGLRAAMNDGGPRAIMAVYRAVASSGEGNIIGNSFGQSFNHLIIYRTDSIASAQYTNNISAPPRLEWSDASANNGSTKLHASNAASTGGALWINDMVTAKTSHSTDITSTNTSDLFIGRRQSVYFDGAINFIPFGGATFDQAYRENVKAWCEAAPRGATFG